MSTVWARVRAIAAITCSTISSGIIGVGAVGPRVHVAVAAGHVAELADVDLEDLQRARPQRSPGQGLELDPLALPLERHRGERAELLGGRGERRSAPAQRRRRTRGPAVVGEIVGDRLERRQGKDFIYIPNLRT